MRTIFRRQTTAGDLRLAVTASGDPGRRPVVLVHGMGGDNSTWRPLAHELRGRGRSVVSVDLRGHGRSGHAKAYGLDDFRDDLEFVVDQLGVTDFDLVGHSLGAHTALRLGMVMPERVSHLVLEECPPMPRDQADLDEQIEPASNLGETVRGLVATVSNPLPLLRFDHSLPRKVGSQFQVADGSWWAELAAVQVPTLVISGGERSFLPPRHLRSLAAALPDGTFALIDAGHSVHRDQSRRFGRSVIEFLSR